MVEPAPLLAIFFELSEKLFYSDFATNAVLIGFVPRVPFSPCIKVVDVSRAGSMGSRC